MTRSRRPSAQTTAVLLALAADPTAWRYGYELCQQLGLKAGSMYPILMRLADRGLLQTSWESDPPRGRPPRHLYRLTGPGVDLAAELAGRPTTAAAGPSGRAAARGRERTGGRAPPGGRAPTGGGRVPGGGRGRGRPRPRAEPEGA